MHETGICEGLVDLIEEKAAGRQVTGVRLRIGARHAVACDAFGEAFALAAGGTVADGAEVDLTVTPMSVECRRCGHSAESYERPATCPGCGAGEVRLAGGDELVLESIRYAGARAGGAPASRPPR